MGDDQDWEKFDKEYEEFYNSPEVQEDLRERGKLLVCFLVFFF